MHGRAALALAFLVLLACSDDQDDTSSTSPTSSTTTAAGGSGGDGGMGTGGAGATGGSAGVMCGGDIAFTPHFGCDVNALTQRIGDDEVTIGYGFDGADFIYEPKCVHVCKGVKLTFEPIDGTDFNIHPLQGGEPPGDPDSPFGYVLGAHQTETFTLTEAGSFPYFCDAHLNAGMTGAVYVQ